MLADFQQAMVDLTSSPDLCVSVRQDRAVLRKRYSLTDREHHRLADMVDHPGMECMCMLYRANRLAPLLMNAPDTCSSLGPALRDLVDEFWLAFPETNVHFFVETDRFMQFLLAKHATGGVPAAAVDPLQREAAIVATALRVSYTERNRVGPPLAAAEPELLDAP